ncbi:MAG: hypothetical protein WCX12_02720 [Candidatus Paceibacterota bacterium]
MLRVKNCASVGIIYRANQPGQVFLETKTPGYPVEVFVGKGLLLGGNWVGSVPDKNPLETFQREIREELSFGNPAFDPQEVELLFGEKAIGHPSEVRNISPDPQDEIELEKIVSTICNGAKPFGVFSQKVSRSLFDSGNLKNRADDHTGLISVFEVPLEDDTWLLLMNLQEKFGNLSNESQSTATSVWEILKRGIQLAWGEDRILMQHFLRHGIDEAAGMRLMPFINLKYWGPVADNYDTYLQSMEIEKIPNGVERPKITS